ncbi:MAG: CHAD domain-containing protein [Thermoleophilaceae bacterium]
MAKARPVPGLGADMPLREAAAAIVEVRAKELFEFADAVLDTTDIEHVHDMRVASRRLRAALEVFAACFPKRELRRCLTDVKRLADALGERRDPDVALAAVSKLARRMPQADRPGLQSYAATLERDQVEANDTLQAVLTQMEEQALEERLAALVAMARNP